jgi:hypothetical protein
MPTTELPTQAQVQAQYNAASEAGVSPCMWIPPKWQELQDGQNSGTKVLPDNSGDDALFNDPTVIDAWKNHIDECAAKKPPEGPERPPRDDTWPNPFGPGRGKTSWRLKYLGVSWGLEGA